MSSVLEELPQQETEEGRKLTVLEHLEELRKRLIYCVIGVAITTAISFAFTQELLRILQVPAGNTPFITYEVTEQFSTYFKVAFYSGLGLGLPVVLYHVIRFLLPGLTRQERRYIRFLLPGSLFCFALGVLFAYNVALPPALRFLIQFLPADIATSQIRLANYVSFVTTLLFGIGAVFETPIVIYFLAKLRIVNHKMLAKNRKYALLGVFVVAAIVTPTPDPVTQTVVALPLLALYEAGVWLARIA